MTNIFLRDWNTPFGFPPFDQITDDDFAPAFEIGLQEDLSAIQKVAENTDAPTFENTIDALQHSGQTL
jgi:peptidyl-dipeptidase Dcp